MGASLAAITVALLSAACVSDRPGEPRGPPDSGRQLLERGVQSYERRDYEAAATDFTEALSYYRSYDLAGGIVRSRINLARIELDLGRPEAARAHVRAARTVAARAAGVDFGARLDLLDSTAALELGALEEAARRIEPHLPGIAADGDGDGDTARLSTQQLSFLANRVALAFERGDADRARWVEHLARALAAQDRAPPVLEGRLARFRARLATQSGQQQRALALLDTAIDHDKRARNRAGIAAALEMAAEIHAGRGERRRAREHLDRALYLHLAIRNARATHANLEKRLAWLEPEPARRQALSAWIDRLAKPDELDWASLRDSVIAENRSDQ